LCAEPLVGEEPFAILLGDDLIDATVPCTKQLMEVFEEEDQSVVGVMEVPLTEVSKYGIVEANPLSTRLFQVKDLTEKPRPEEAPSRFAIPGRYVLKATIFNHLKRVREGQCGEIQLTDGLRLIAEVESLLAYRFEGTRFDTGDRLGFIDATLAYALKRPELRGGVMSLIEKYRTMN